MDFTIAADLKPAVGWEEENAPTIDLGLPRPHPKGNDYKKGQYLTAWFKIATEGVEGGDVEGSSEMET